MLAAFPEVEEQMLEAKNVREAETEAAAATERESARRQAQDESQSASQRPPVEEFAGWGHPTALGLLHLQSGDAGAAASRAAAATPAPRPPGAPFEFEVY